MSETVHLALSVIEAAHLTDLVEQFIELLEGTIDAEALTDPAIARLVPDAYRGDAEAAAEFRRLTQDDLLDRRRDDAALMLGSLQPRGERLIPAGLSDREARAEIDLPLDQTAVAAWLRTLTAVRLVMAVRLEIGEDDPDDADDPRLGLYNWLGYRLELLLQAIDR